MKNSIGEEFDVQRNDITFTQLSGKHLKCNNCWEKITRNWVESHRNSHRPNKPKVANQVSNTRDRVSKITTKK